MADKRIRPARQHFDSAPIVKKEPFRDADGKIWIYRDDDDRKTPVALGPFFTPDYARAAKQFCRENNAPLPLALSHSRPRPPFTVCKRYDLLADIQRDEQRRTSSQRPAHMIERFDR